MRVIIFHYHLNPGGVTRIIESQVAALASSSANYEITLLTGSCSDRSYYEQFNVAVVVEPELNYLLPRQNNYIEQFERINTIVRSWCKKEDILHFHNLNLGKNPLVTLAVSRMAYEGFKILNHAHDFSEDRPDNQSFLHELIHKNFKEDLKSVMYPPLDNYFYSTLNSSDNNRLLSYGVEGNRCIILPNPVEFSSSGIEGNAEEWKEEICSALNLDKNKKIITYPVRVIRRKNVGEFVLLASIFSDEANWVVTQPPKNPIEIEPYEKWKKFCDKENIKVHWEAGTKVDFVKLIKSSDFCLTTSIQEGFGMVFMEPWLLGTPVKGRNIPMVTEDIKASGIEFPSLYDKFILINGKELHELKQSEQFEAIQELNCSTEKRDLLLNTNPFLKDLLNPTDGALINKNNEVILGEYSLDTYGNKLHGIYRRIIE